MFYHRIISGSPSPKIADSLIHKWNPFLHAPFKLPVCFQIVEDRTSKAYQESTLQRRWRSPPCKTSCHHLHDRDKGFIPTFCPHKRDMGIKGALRNSPPLTFNLFRCQRNFCLYLHTFKKTFFSPEDDIKPPNIIYISEHRHPRSKKIVAVPIFLCDTILPPRSRKRNISVENTESKVNLRANKCKLPFFR